jgi:flavin reductase (DIM6/NTAB) family NADH-FMN oxidoreductase RutF
LECKYSEYSLIIGEVVNIHARKDVIVKHTRDDGREILDVDMAKVKTVSRLGCGQEYTVCYNRDLLEEKEYLWLAYSS